MKRKLKNELELDLEAGMLAVQYIWQRNGSVQRTEKAIGGCSLCCLQEVRWIGEGARF